MNPTFANAATRQIDAAGCAFLYREIGAASAAPLLLLNHLTGVLEDWDPAVVDGLAANRRVIIFDNRGVGGSAGITPTNIADMARDAIAFIDALRLTNIDLLGFSMGGFIAQLIAHDRPDLVRRLILAGTGPAGGAGIDQVAKVLQAAVAESGADHRHAKHILFFSQTPGSQRAADEFLLRLKDRGQNRDLAVSNETVAAHLVAITHWGSDAAQGRPLREIKLPVLVVNGDDDIMVPTDNSIDLFHALPDAELSIFPDSGHGGIFQYHREFVTQASRFLEH
ncbi:MAG: alpha/beta hydrolase [Pseudomonadota bacterium]